MTIGWLHPVDESDQWDGYNESGIEHFKSNYIYYLAREIIQNSNDARTGSQVRVKFSLKEILTSTIPNIDELRENITHCLNASDYESHNAKIFFRNALKKISSDKVKILEISDFNTSGMRGPCKNGTPFYAFMKAKGQSKKDDETSSGSFGIGKFAPYASSEIRTVFASTIYEDSPGECKQLSQGKALLMSHDVGAQRRQGTGFWGAKEKCQPIEGHEGLPSWLVRADDEEKYCELIGSKICIICFDDVDEWRELLAVSVAENFFAAIASDKLSVDIDGEYFLDRSTLHQFFINTEIENLLNTSGIRNEPEQFKNAYEYYKVLLNTPDVIVETKEHIYLGLIKLRIIVDSGLPKKVCALRNGMFISDYVAGMKRFTDFKDFVAIFECESEKGNRLLRQMEPPKHDDFEPSRMPTKDEQDKAKKCLVDISKWVRSALGRYARDPVSEVTPLDELKDFFGDEGGDGSGQKSEEVNPVGKLNFRAKPLKPKAPSSVATLVNIEGDDKGSEGEDGDGGGGLDGRGGGGSRSGKGAADGGTGGGGKIVRTVEVMNSRAILTGPNKRRLLFTPTVTGKIAFTVLQAGADYDYNTKINKSDLGEVKSGSVIIDVIKGERVGVNVELLEDFNGALKVVAYEV